VRENRFREDLFYRLNVVQLELPPLRERIEDIIPLAEHLLAFFGRTHHRVFGGFTDEAREKLKQYGWPGNLRELRNTVERATIFATGDLIASNDLPESLSQLSTLGAAEERMTLHALEERHIRRTLAAAKTLQDAADTLGIDQTTLWRKRKQYGI
jgi:NtrC-family two-component system response regulator AlgB